MKSLKRCGMLLAMSLAFLAMGMGQSVTTPAQVATTTVQDTVYRADGTAASGTVLVSWSAFTTAAGQAVAAGSTSVTIGAGGVLSVALAPNVGATPTGSYYTAVLHLNDGTTQREYWSVPVAASGTVTLAAIRNTVLPATVAMQTVSKQYVDNAIAQAQAGITPADSSAYVMKTGDTMTGPLVLPADPVSNNQAADKHYVDTNVAAVSAAVSGKVSLLPSGSQTVSQPSGTQLRVNNLNGELHATPYVNGGGSNGIANALGSADCANGCKLQVEPTYPSTEQLSLLEMPSGTAVVDARGGAEVHTVVNPQGAHQTSSLAKTVTQVETMSTPQLEAIAPGALGVYAVAMQLNSNGLAGGSNLNPGNIETPPYFKSTYGTLSMNGVYNTQGQHVQAGSSINCYGVGDCLAGAQYLVSSGGYRDAADEGAHPFDLEVTEDVRVFAGTCATGCSTGATSIAVTPTANGGTQGDGRFLIDRAAAKVISTGTIVGAGRTIFAIGNFSGTSFPVSVFLSTAAAAKSQPANMAPGTLTLPIATSGVTAGFATSTAALPSTTGVACVADVETSQGFPNYEMVPYTVVDGSDLQLTLNKPHASGATIAVGGLCGYGLEQTVDTVNGIRQVFPVIGSRSATSLYYADGVTPVIGFAGPASTSGYQNVSLSVASIARTSNVVTVTTASTLPIDVNGLTLTVSGVADSSYNGSFAVTTTGSNQLTYASTGADSTSSGGTLGFVAGGFALYPMAEVLSVYNASTKLVDGAFTLAPNTVAWAAGDTVEEPHYHQQSTFADVERVTQYVPRPVQYASAGKTYAGQVGPGVRGWQIINDVAASNYLSAGGTHTQPDDAYAVVGVWNNDFEVDAGFNAIVRAHCNARTCSRWNSGYKLFDLDSVRGNALDNMSFSPQTDTFGWNVAGTGYTMSPTALTAGTINVGTLNATTISGGVNGASITSGTISPTVLPVFGPSGTTHAAGIVPDPGATAGSTHYLREDGTWSVPAGGSGASSAAATPAGGTLVMGDSIGTGTGATDVYNDGFAYLLRPQIGGSFTNDSHSGDGCLDTSYNYINSSVNPTEGANYPTTVLECGTNNIAKYGSSANLQNTFRRIYTHMVYWTGVPQSAKSEPGSSLTNWTATGTWAADTSQGTVYPSYSSTTNASKLQYAFTCSTACVAVLGYPIWNGNGGTFTVALDGTAVTDSVAGSGTTFYSAGDAGAAITDNGGATMGLAAMRVSAAAGSHTLAVTVTSATGSANMVGVNYVALVPAASTSNPNVLAISPNHRNDSAANETLSTTYAGYISSIVTQAATDGVNVFYADTRNALLNTNNAVSVYVGSPSTSYTATGWVSDTGVSYAANATALAKVTTSPAQGQYAVSSAGVYSFSAADAIVPLVVKFTINCGSSLTTMFASCYTDSIHPNNFGHAVMAAKMLTTLPARLVTGNTTVATTTAVRPHMTQGQFPSQMMSPNPNNISGSTGFAPGVNFFCSTSQCWFLTMTAAGGLTAVGPPGAGVPVFTVSTYNSPVQPTSESQLSSLLKITGNGVFTSNSTVHQLNGQLNVNGSQIASAYLSVSQNNYSAPVAALTNAHNYGVTGLEFVGSGTGGRSFQTGVGNAFDNYCTVPGKWFLADMTSGACVVRETVDSTGLHTFNAAVSVPLLVVSGSAPTVAVAAAAGTSATATVTGTNMAGVLTVVTGTSTAAAGALTTVTFNGTVAAAPKGCQLMPNNAAAAAAVTTVYTTAPTTTSWGVAAGAQALPASTTLAWSYHCF